jgi:hypothetical protein
MNTEQVATSTIENFLARTETLMAHINKNDKVPIWDGEVFVYKSKPHSNENLIGRVPVQVKGIIDKRKSSGTMYFPYSIDMIDVKNYYNDNGVIYFVVKITDTECTPFYLSLLPADLFNIMELAKNQKSKRLKFKRFPNLDTPLAMQKIFTDFIQHRNLQSSVKQIGIKTEEELRKAGYTDHFFTVQDQNLFNSLGKQIYRYSKNSLGQVACSGPAVLSRIAGFDKNITIASANKIFFTGGVIDTNLNNVSVIFGDNALQIITNKDPSHSGNIVLNPCGKLSTVKTSLEFLLEAFKSKSFTINTQKFILNKFDVDDERAKSDLLNNLEILEKIQRLLSVIKCDKDPIFDNFEAINNLYAVANSLLNGHEINVSHVDRTGLLRISLNQNGDYLLFRIETSKTGNQAFIVKDLFSSHPPLEVMLDIPDNTSITIKHSHFLLLHETDFYKSLNFNIDVVQADVLSYIKQETTEQVINLILIHYWFKLLKAFDATGNVVFIEKASEILLRIKTVKNLQQPMRDALFLNELQTTKRLRELSPSEIQELEIFVQQNKPAEQLLGAYLLKNDMVKAHEIFNSMPTRDQDIFVTYPIYKFWNN